MTGKGRAERLVLFGKSGSGKTTLAKTFLKSVHNAIIVDTKLEEDWSDCALSIHGNDIYQSVLDPGKAGRFVWHVPDSFLVDLDEQDRFFRTVLKRGNRVVYVDELADVGPTANTYSIGLKLVAQRGRAAGVGLWGSTQRPHAVPLFTISEAQYVVTFEMALRRDRDRIDQVFQTRLNYDVLDGTHLFYVKHGRTVGGPMQLNLGEEAA